jgi:hypothetical protein
VSRPGGSLRGISRLIAAVPPSARSPCHSSRRTPLLPRSRRQGPTPRGQKEASEDQLLFRPFTAVCYVTLDLEPEQGGAITVQPNPTSSLA